MTTPTLEERAREICRAYHNSNDENPGGSLLVDIIDALNEAYERGQRDMREECALFVDNTVLPPRGRNPFWKSMMTKVAAGIRAIPITPDSEKEGEG